jgi:hypothetical protein
MMSEQNGSLQQTSTETSNPASAEFLESTLTRLRVNLRNYQDEMDMCAFTIRCLERDLEEIQKEDKEANEKNA